MGIDDPFFKKSEREHMAALLAGATGPTAELSLDQVVGGGPIKLDVPAAPPRTHFYSDVLAAEGLPALPIWEPDPAEPRGGDRLRLLTGPGHFQHHSVFAGVDRLQRLEGEPCCVLHPDDAGQRGIVDGDAVVLENERGYVGLRAQVTADTLPGVVTVLAQRSRTQYLCGGPLNVLVSDDLTDMGAGATYQSTWVDVRPLGEEHVPQHQAAP
jgi:anaerobic selenocysteine-containing dehydrogenase